MTLNEKDKSEHGDIIIYQPDQTSSKLEVRIEDETVWLTQAQMIELFDSTKQNVSLHINNIFREKELDRDSTVKENLTVQIEGNRKIHRKINLYNLDIKKHNSQYDPIEVIKFEKSHDRFLIIDNSTVYHIGASLKDVGKKWFAFSKIELDPKEMIEKLK